MDEQNKKNQISQNDVMNRFKYARMKLAGNESMETVAKKTKVSKNTIYKLEHDGVDTSYKTVCELANYYGVNVAWLMGQSESPSLNEDIQNVARVTGLSTKAISILQEIKGTDLNRILNLLLESKGFADMLFQLNNAMIISASNKQTDEQADLIENLQVLGVANGMDSVNSRLSNRQLIDVYRRKAVESISKTLVEMIKEEKDNGKRNEEI